MKIPVVFAAICFSVAAGQPQTAAPAAHPSPPDRVDACALLADAEIQTTLGETVKARTPSSAPAGGGLQLNQCHFGTDGTHDVSLAVAASPGGASLSPRQYWRQQFHPPAGQTGSSKPAILAIAGVGDEAYWAGGAIAGALYALRGDAFIRVSVGGIKSETARIEKSKALALAALDRLQK